MGYIFIVRIPPVVPQSYLRQKLRDIDSTSDGALTYAHSEITCQFWVTMCASLQTGKIKLCGYKKTHKSYDWQLTNGRRQDSRITKIVVGRKILV